MRGPDYPTELATLDDIMQVLGSDEAVRASRRAVDETVVVASSSPLILMRRAQYGDEHKTFEDFMALLPADAQPTVSSWVKTLPKPPGDAEEDEEEGLFDEDTGQKISLGSYDQRIGDLLKSSGLSEAYRDIVRKHMKGEQTFFRVETEVTIKVPYSMTVMAGTKEEADRLVERIKDGSLNDGNDRFDVDTSQVLASALSRASHLGLAKGGWNVNAKEMSKLTLEEVKKLAKNLIEQKLADIEDDTRSIARMLGGLSRQRH